jgi:hypothetical protein
MALIELTKVDRIEIVGDFKHLQVREKICFIDDQTQEEKGSKYHRKTIDPGTDLSQETVEIQAIGNAVWTEEILSNWENYKISQGE